MNRRVVKNAPRDDEIVRPIKQTTTNYRVFTDKILRCHRERSEAIHCTAETGDRAQEMDHRVAKKLLAMTAPSGC